MNRPMHFRRIAFGVASLICIACGSGVPTSPSPAPPPPVISPSPFPSPPSKPYTVTGNIVDTQGAPVADVSVNIWIQLERSGYSYWWANGPLRSDAGGHFVAPNIPSSEITVFASQNGYVQPCAVRAEIGSDLALDVELISWAVAESVNPPRPRIVGGPVVTGLVFETTATGRQPVPGAALWIETGFEIATATGRTDARGAFMLCNLPRDAFAYVMKAGYQPWQGRIDTSGTEPLNIELKRMLNAAAP